MNVVQGMLYALTGRYGYGELDFAAVIGPV